MESLNRLREMMGMKREPEKPREDMTIGELVRNMENNIKVKEERC